MTGRDSPPRVPARAGGVLRVPQAQQRVLLPSPAQNDSNVPLKATNIKGHTLDVAWGVEISVLERPLGAQRKRRGTGWGGWAGRKGHRQWANLPVSAWGCQGQAVALSTHALADRGQAGQGLGQQPGGGGRPREGGQSELFPGSTLHSPCLEQVAGAKVTLPRKGGSSPCSGPHRRASSSLGPSVGLSWNLERLRGPLLGLAGGGWGQHNAGDVLGQQEWGQVAQWGQGRRGKGPPLAPHGGRGPSPSRDLGGLGHLEPHLAACSAGRAAAKGPGKLLGTGARLDLTSHSSPACCAHPPPPLPLPQFIHTPGLGGPTTHAPKPGRQLGSHGPQGHMENNRGARVPEGTPQNLAG